MGVMLIQGKNTLKKYNSNISLERVFTFHIRLIIKIYFSIANVINVLTDWPKLHCTCKCSKVFHIIIPKVPNNDKPARPSVCKTVGLPVEPIFF